MFCDSVSCWISGCDDIKTAISQRLGIDYGETTSDNSYTLLPVPCLGACDRAPVMMIDDELVTHIDDEKVTALFGKATRRAEE